MARPRHDAPPPVAPDKPLQVIAYSRVCFGQEQIPVLFDPRVAAGTVEFRDLQGRVVGSILNVREPK